VDRHRIDMGMTHQNALEDTKASEKSLRILVIAVGTAQFLLPFMVTAMAALLPAIGKSLDASAIELSFVLASYTLALSIMHLVAGRIGDMLGRKRIFLFGLALFTIVTALAPLSPSIEVFLVLRFIQALGAAMMNTSALAILAASAPPAMRGRVLGVAATGLFLGLSLGPFVAGMVTSIFTWHAMFYGLIPICIFAWCIMFYTVKGEWYDAPDDPFDWIGAILYTLGIGAFTFGSIWILEGWWAVALTVAGIVLLGIFAFVESRVRHPILDVYFLTHNRSFVIGALAAFINYASTFGAIFYTSLYLQMIHGLTVLEAGFFLSIQPIAQIFTARLSGNLGDRFGAARVSTFGMMICGISLWLLGGFDTNTSYTIISLSQLVLGIGVSLFVIPNTSDILGSVDSAHLGQASGIVGTVRTLGMLVCMMIIALSMNVYLGSEPLSESNSGAFLDAMQMNFRIFSILNIIGVVISSIRLLTKKNIEL